MGTYASHTVDATLGLLYANNAGAMMDYGLFFLPLHYHTYII